jgi:hypothetical protein
MEAGEWAERNEFVMSAMWPEKVVEGGYAGSFDFCFVYGKEGNRIRVSKVRAKERNNEDLVDCNNSPFWFVFCCIKDTKSQRYL